MPRSAKMGELKRAAQELGVSSQTLREQGWKTACAARIQAVRAQSPDWLIAAQTRRTAEVARRQVVKDRALTARKLAITVREVKSRNIALADVPGLTDERPDWLIAAQEHRRAQNERHEADRARRTESDGRQDEIDAAYLRACKDNGDTGAWAAGVLHAAGIRTITSQDGAEVPVLPPQTLRVIRGG